MNSVMEAMIGIVLIYLSIPLFIDASPVSIQQRRSEDFASAPFELWRVSEGSDRSDDQVRRKRSITRLRYKDCGKEQRSIMFDQLSVKPIPIQIPGFLDLRIKANITRKLPSTMDVKMVLKKKYFDSQWMRIPCIEDYGSCRYKKMQTCTLTQELFGCPVRTGYHSIDQKFIIPDPEDSLFSQMLEGEYKAIVRARHPTTRKELACLVAHFSLTNRPGRAYGQ